MSSLFTPYEGSEPYIFVSYSHADSHRVFPILTRLNQSGFRIWFDEGIEWGTEWPESIADHLARSTVCMIFLSASSAGSPNCRQEIRYALKQEKGILSVYLEDTDLSRGMDMQLSSYQQTFPYQYDDMEQFYSRLEETPLLLPCKRPAQEGTDTAPGKTAPAPAAPKARPKWLIPAVAGLCVAVAVLLSAVLLPRGGAGQSGQSGPPPATSQPEQEDSPAPETSPAPEETPAPQPSAPYHILLTAGDDFSVRGFLDAAELLRGRLDAFTGGEGYEMSVDGDRIDLLLQRDLISQDDLDQALECYFCLPTELYAFSLQDYTQHVALKRGDFESVQIVHGTVPGAAPEQLGFEADAYDYVEVTLTAACAQRIGQQIADWGDSFSFAEDIPGDGSRSFYYYTTFPAGDGRTFRVVNNDQGEGYTRLTAHILTHEPYEAAFTYSLVWDDILWEEPEGVNQQAGGDFDQPTVTIALSCYGNLTAGDWLDTRTFLRQRLDALDQPYAIGRREGQDDALYVRTELGHMCLELMPLLGDSSGYVTLRAGLLEETYSGHSLEIVQGEDGGYQLRFTPDRYDAEDLDSQLSHALEGNGQVQLVLHDAPFFSATVTAMPEDGVLVFDRSPYAGDGPIGEDWLWLLQFVKQVAGGDTLPYTFYPEYQFDPGPDGGLPTAGDFGAVDALLQRDQLAFRQSVLAQSPGAQVWFNQYSAYVDLHMAVDDALPGQSTDLVQSIYQASDFENSSLTGLTFYLIDEDNAVTERARIFFSKNFYPLSMGSGRIRVWGIFANGRILDYAEEFQSILSESPFYSALSDENSWTFGTYG